MGSNSNVPPSFPCPFRQWKLDRVTSLPARADVDRRDEKEPESSGGMDLEPQEPADPSGGLHGLGKRKLSQPAPSQASAAVASASQDQAADTPRPSPIKKKRVSEWVGSVAELVASDPSLKNTKLRFLGEWTPLSPEESLKPLNPELEDTSAQHIRITLDDDNLVFMTGLSPQQLPDFGGQAKGLFENPVRLFFALMPRSFLTGVMAEMSRRSRREISKEQFVTFLGLLIMRGAGPRGLNRFWKAKVRGKTGKGKGRINMSKSRFRDLWACFRLCVDGQDPFCEAMDALFDDFTMLRRGQLSGPLLITLDESSSRWYGSTRKDNPRAGVDVVNSKSKPESQAMDVKTAVVAGPGLKCAIWRFRALKKVQEADLVAEAGTRSGTYMILRTLSPYLMPGNSVCTDSLFSSVLSSAVALSKGATTVGAVKTASKGFPLFQLQQMNPAPGKFVAMKNTLEEPGQPKRDVVAVLWNLPKPRTWICTTGTPAAPTQVKVNRSSENMKDLPPDTPPTIEGPMVAVVYNQRYPLVDQDNRFRQSEASIELNVRTRSAQARLLTTVLGMVLTDTFRLATGGHNPHPNRETYYTFVEELGECLARGIPAAFGSRSSEETKERLPKGSFFQRCRESGMHRLKPAYKLFDLTPEEKKVKRFRRQCVMCGTKTSLVCACCSTLDDPVFVCDRDSDDGRICELDHQHEMEGDD